MTINRVGEYLVDVDLKGRISIGIESSRLPDCVNEAKQRRANGVFGAPCFGFTQDNLDFLRDLPDLEKIWFWDINLKNIQGVYGLKNLKYFGIHPKRPGIDFEQLSTIEELIWEYNAKDIGFTALRCLKLFHIWHFNPKSKSFSELRVPPTITEMQINWANPNSFMGFPTLPKLSRLEISNCRNLKTIFELSSMTPNLEHLVISNCRKIYDGKQLIAQLPKIKHAFINDGILVNKGA